MKISNRRTTNNTILGNPSRNQLGKLVILILLSFAILLPMNGVVTTIGSASNVLNSFFGVRATLTMDDDNDIIVGLDDSWMLSYDNDLWETASSNHTFGGDQTVYIATKNNWADVPYWVKKGGNQDGNFTTGQRVIYDDILWECREWNDGNTPPNADKPNEWENKWKIISSDRPVAEYTFEFTKKSDQSILEFLEKERQRIASTKHVFAYMPSWGVYGGHEYFDVNSIDYSHVTHMTYSFVKPIDTDKFRDYWKDDNYERPISGETGEQNKDNIVPSSQNFGVRFDDPDAALYAGGSWNAGGDILKRIKTEIAKYPDKYFVFSVGGWSYAENKEFEIATSTPERIDQFAQSIVDFMYKYGFDGIDIDWEFPLSFNETNSYGTFKPAQQFLDLHRVLREKLTELSMQTEKYYQLSTATTPNINNIQYIQPQQLVQYVDTVNYMAYDYHGGSFGASSPTNHNAPLYEPLVGTTEANFWIDAVAKEYERQGVPKNQLLMGVAFYGRSWNTVGAGSDPNHPGLGQMGTAPDSAAEAESGHGGLWGNGSNPYYRYEDLQAGTVSGVAKDYKYYRDEQAMVPYLYSATDKVFHSFDDAWSIGKKIDYIIDNDYAGTIIWDITGDTRTNKGTSGAFTLGNIVKPLVGMPNAQADDARITNTKLPDVEVGTEYSTLNGSQINVTGGGDIQVKLEDAPSWLSLDTTNNQLKGTPQESDKGKNIAIKISAVGDTGKKAEKIFYIEVIGEPDLPAPPSILGDVNGLTLVYAEVAIEYGDKQETVKIKSDADDITLELSNFSDGSNWLTIGNVQKAQATQNYQYFAHFSGIPKDPGNITFDLTATDNFGQSTIVKVSLRVAVSDPTITTPNRLPDALVDTNYNKVQDTQIKVTETTYQPEFSIESQDANTLSIDPITGQLSGIFVLSQTDTIYNLKVKVTDGTGQTTTRDFTINVKDDIIPPTIDANKLPAATVDEPYNYEIKATGVDLQWTITQQTTNNLLSINNSGNLSGTFTQANPSYTLTIQVTDIKGQSTNKTFTIVVKDKEVPPPPVIDPPQITTQYLPDATVDEPYTAEIKATSTQSLTWSIIFQDTQGLLSVSGNGTTVQLKGTFDSSQVGEYHLTISVNDGTNPAQTKDFIITVKENDTNPPPPPVEPPPTNDVDIELDWGDGDIVANEFNDITINIENAEYTSVGVVGLPHGFRLTSVENSNSLNKTYKIQGFPTQSGKFDIVFTISMKSREDKTIAKSIEIMQNNIMQSPDLGNNSTTSIIIVLVIIDVVIVVGAMIFLFLKNKKQKNKVLASTTRNSTVPLNNTSRPNYAKTSSANNNNPSSNSRYGSSANTYGNRVNQNYQRDNSRPQGSNAYPNNRYPR